MSDEHKERVFISYSHDSPEHERRVEELANRLRNDGVDTHIDQYVPNPPMGWPRWMADEIRQATYVLAVCGGPYCRRADGQEEPGKGLGATWEGSFMWTHLYEAGGSNEKFIPVYFEQNDAEHIPEVLKSTTRYSLMDQYEKLYRRLTNQPECVPPPLGKRLELPLETAGYSSGVALQDSVAENTTKRIRSLQEALEAGVKITIGQLEDRAIRETLQRMNQSRGEVFQAFRNGLLAIRQWLPDCQARLIDLHIEFGVTDPAVIGARIRDEIRTVLEQTAMSLAARFRGPTQSAARKTGILLVPELLTAVSNAEDYARVELARKRIAGDAKSPFMILEHRQAR